MNRPPRGSTLKESKLASRVCSMDDSILYCAVIGPRGEIGATASSDGQGDVPESEVEILAKRWAIVRGIDDTADELLGPTRSAIIFRKGVTLISVSAGNGKSVFVGARPDFDASKIKEIEGMVASSDV
jgi:hypothetical protein